LNIGPPQTLLEKSNLFSADPGSRATQGRLIAGIGGSNPAEGMNIPFFYFLCVV
jgi:hypothetical protein